MNTMPGGDQMAMISPAPRGIYVCMLTAYSATRPRLLSNALRTTNEEACNWISTSVLGISRDTTTTYFSNAIGALQFDWIVHVFDLCLEYRRKRNKSRISQSAVPLIGGIYSSFHHPDLVSENLTHGIRG